MVLLDAVLAGGKGLNLWCSYSRASANQSARLSRALVDSRLCASVNSILIATEQPYVYSLTAAIMAGASLDETEERMTGVVETLAEEPPSPRELEKARHQVLARLVFENEGVTLAAHQIGYFETLGASREFRELPARIQAVTDEDLVRVASRYLARRRRTVGQYIPTGNGNWEA